MNTEFPSKVRRRPTRARRGDATRDSNLIRASVLETALELGFGQNSTVADWIFNNPLAEEAEEPLPEQSDHVKLDPNADPVLEVPEAATPIFTSGPNSISDESSSLNSPANIAPSAAVVAIQVHTHKPSITEPPQVHFDDFPTDQLQLFSPFSLSPHDVPRGETGNTSLTKPPKENERSRSQDDSLPCNHNHENPSPGSADAGYTSEGQYLSKGKAGKGKDKSGKSKRVKGSKSKTVDDGKTSEKDGDYTSDGGYLSASSNKSQSKSSGRVKSRAMAFFRRRPKKSASDDEDEASIPPVPALPTIPRPSSPKILERRPTPSSPTRSGFSPLTLNLTSPPVSPPRRRVSKSPPPPHRTASPKRLDHISAPQRPVSPLVTSMSAPTTLTPATAVSPLPSSAPGTPLSTASFPSTSSQSTSLGGAGSTPKSLSTSSSRQHLSIPPPAPPPTLPLPQPPPSPSIGLNGGLPLPATPTTPSGRRTSTRPVPAVPASLGSTQPLSPHRAASPLRPLLSPRTMSAASQEQLDGKEFTGRQRSATAGFGNTPAFLQRRIQHGPPPSPRRPPPDTPLPPSPSPVPSTRPRTPVAPSKFHEHFSSVSSVPLSQILSTPTSLSPSLSTATLSESSSGPSMRSSYVSSVSGRSEDPVRELNVPEASRPPTSASTISESSYGQPIAPSFSRPAIDSRSHFSGWSDVSSSIYSSTMHRESSSVTTYYAEDTAPKIVDQEDDEASVYPSEDKTAGRRTMYLLENGELDESGDEIVIAGSCYWDGHEVPPVPPLPTMPTLPGPGYF